MKTKRKRGRLFGALMCGTMLAGLLSVTAFAEGTGVAINETNFPDENFREIVKSFDTDGDSVLNSSEIEEVLSIDCEEKEISSLKGIEHFTVLEYLDCYNNQLTSLDVSNNTALEGLLCDNNQLTDLDVSQNTGLQKLCCSDNQLSGLDVSQNTELNMLYCYGNQLSKLDVSQNIVLEYLWCSDNQLTDLDVSQNTALSMLECDNNQLSKLDVSRNTALGLLNCGCNQLSSLDVSQNTALMDLDCANNQLSSLDVSKNTALESLDCAGNQLTNLDVSENTALEWLSCSYNQLSSLDLSKNTLLWNVECDNNQYTIKVPEDRIFDLSTLPGFDVNKASNWQGGTVDGNQLHVNDGVETVTYEYDCGNNCDVTFSLEVNTCDFDQIDINTDAKQTIADRIHDVLNKIVKRTFLRYFFSSSGKMNEGAV